MENLTGSRPSFGRGGDTPTAFPRRTPPPPKPKEDPVVELTDTDDDEDQTFLDKFKTRSGKTLPEQTTTTSTAPLPPGDPFGDLDDDVVIRDTKPLRPITTKTKTEITDPTGIPDMPGLTRPLTPEEQQAVEESKTSTTSTTSTTGTSTSSGDIPDMPGITRPLTPEEQQAVEEAKTRTTLTTGTLPEQTSTRSGNTLPEQTSQKLLRQVSIAGFSEFKSRGVSNEEILKKRFIDREPDEESVLDRFRPMYNAY